MALNSIVPLFLSDNGIKLMRVFMGNLSSKMLKCHFVNKLWSKIYAPLRTLQHTMAANGGVTKAMQAFSRHDYGTAFLIFVTIYVPILYLPTFSESNAWDFHLVMTGIFENVPLRGDFRRFSMTFRRDFRTLPKCPQMFRRRLSYLRWPEPIYLRVGYVFESGFSAGMI